MGVTDDLKRTIMHSPALRSAVVPAYRAVANSVSSARFSAYSARDGAGALGREVTTPRVVLDGAAFTQRIGGIPRLWREIMQEWVDSGFARQVVVLDRRRSAPRLPGFTYREVPPLGAFDNAAHRAMLERVCRSEAADVFVSTLYTAPAACRTVLFVHDLTPEALGWDPDDPFHRERRRAIRHASAFACLSRHTHDELLSHYPEVAGRPSIIATPGVGSGFVPPSSEAVARFRALNDLPERYYLFIGHRDSYKNAALLFGALRTGSVDSDVGVVLLGGRRRLEPAYLDVAQARTVRLIPELAEEDLPLAYAGARALVYPSKREGFGLPVLEAMACGCPVITSGSTALPEAGGDAAIIVDADDPAALANAMRAVLDEAERARRLEAGMAHAAGFRWEDCAEAVAEQIRRTASAQG